MARTTIDLDPSILRELRRRSLSEGESLGQVASELLARAIVDQPDLPAPQFVWHTGMLGPALVDLEDKEAAREVLDRD